MALLLSGVACDIVCRVQSVRHACHPLGSTADVLWQVIWDVVRACLADHPVKKEGAALLRLMLVGMHTALPLQLLPCNISAPVDEMLL